MERQFLKCLYLISKETFIKLFEFIYDSDHYIRELKEFYESLGLKVKVIKQENMAPALDVADNSKFEYNWQSDKNTGMFFYFFDEQIGDEVKYSVHINSIVIAKRNRGTGLASKMIRGLVDIFGEDLREITLDDMSNSDFWKFMEKKHNHINWVIEEN